MPEALGPLSTKLVTLRERAVEYWCGDPGSGCSVIRPLTERIDREHLDPNRLELLRFQYERALQMVCHDDSMNWRKFFSYLYSSAALAAAMALVVRAEDQDVVAPLSITISLAGLVLSLAFWATLIEGRRCLEGHKDAAKNIESVLMDDHGAMGASILCGGHGPKRQILVWGPAIGAVFWAAIAMVLWSIGSNK